MTSEIYLNLRNNIGSEEIAEIIAREMQVPSGYEVYPNFEEGCWDVYVGRDQKPKDEGVRVLSVRLKKPGEKEIKVFSSVLDLESKKIHLEEAINSAESEL